MKTNQALKPMMTAATVVATAFAAILLVSTASQAKPEMSERGSHGGPMHRLEHIVKAVDATPEQKTKLSDIAKAAEADTQALRTQMKASKERGMALLSAKEIDRGAIEQHRADQLKLHDQMSRRRTQAMVDTAAVLSPEQRVKLAQTMKDKGGYEHSRGHNRESGREHNREHNRNNPRTGV